MSLPADPRDDDLRLARQVQARVNARNRALQAAALAAAGGVGADPDGLPCGACHGKGSILANLLSLGMTPVAAFAKVFPRERLPLRAIRCEPCAGTGRSSIIAGRALPPAARHGKGLKLVLEAQGGKRFKILGNEEGLRAKPMEPRA